MKPSLCLNMIVRNESARIERCLKSVLPHVKAVAILDTGSTDDTLAVIERLCSDAGVHYVGATAPFENFSQARNRAFELARLHNNAERWCQFALLVDADMELIVDDPGVWGSLDATAASYDMMQKGGAVSYGNRRLINLNCAKSPYVGVTHEYIDVGATGMIEGARFIDHADGSNRKDKFPRDAALLEAALAEDPKNGRYLYYLGQTYGDWGKHDLAAETYEKRISLGGWDEETYMSMHNLAFSYKAQGLDELFVSKMVDAYNFRPSRAEPLYHLANYYREKGKNAAASMYAATGLSVPKCGDLLFVNDYVYSHGLRYEYSIAAYYSDTTRAAAFQVTNDYALDPAAPAHERWNARANLWWHLKPLSEHCRSFKDHHIGFSPDKGYTAMNPSVALIDNNLVCNIRCVNYRMDEAGRYLINGTDGEANGTNPIDTKNYLVHLDSNFNVQASNTLNWERPAPLFDLVTGLEDVRIFSRNGVTHFNACVRELNAQGLCQQVEGTVRWDSALVVNDLKVISEWSPNHEKNWMAIPNSQDYVYRLDTVIHPSNAEKVATVHPTKVYVNDISGSSQLIPFRAGYLCVVHEAGVDPTTNKRTYWHRFAWFNCDMELRRISLPFVFLDRQIEFCAGLAYHPNLSDLVISFGVRDAEAHLATVSDTDVASMLWKFHEN